MDSHRRVHPSTPYVVRRSRIGGSGRGGSSLDQNASIKRKAQDLIKKGAYADATAIYEKLADAGDLQSYDYVVLGDLLIRCGKRVEAVERYREALNSYAEAGLSRNAIALAKKVHRLAPKLYFVHRRLGDLYLAEGLEGEACRHYTEYLDRVDREAEGIQDELQHVCEQLLGIDLPSISIVERVVAVAREAGFGEAIAGGILGQAQRALARGDTENHAKLQGLAQEMNPHGAMPEAPSAHAATPSSALFDPSAVSFPEGTSEQPAVLSLEGFTFDALHSVNLESSSPATADEEDETGETDRRRRGRGPRPRVRSRRGGGDSGRCGRTGRGLGRGTLRGGGADLRRPLGDRRRGYGDRHRARRRPGELAHARHGVPGEGRHRPCPARTGAGGAGLLPGRAEPGSRGALPQGRAPRSQPPRCPARSGRAGLHQRRARQDGPLGHRARRRAPGPRDVRGRQGPVRARARLRPGQRQGSRPGEPPQHHLRGERRELRRAGPRRRRGAGRADHGQGRAHRDADRVRSLPDSG